MITLARTDEERQEVLDLFLRIFNDIAPNAVPMSNMDSYYAPLVDRYRIERHTDNPLTPDEGVQGCQWDPPSR